MLFFYLVLLLLLVFLILSWIDIMEVVILILYLILESFSHVFPREMLGAYHLTVHMHMKTPLCSKINKKDV